ncbi:MAG: GIY-YIG nuclease family protein [Candidatus Binataceae bacterium]
MKLRLEWMHPLTLADASDQNLIYSFDFTKLPETAGVYVFGRRYGNQFEALYVGKGGKLRRRTKGHLNNLRLMQHLKNAKNGTRVLLAGRFIPRPGQQEDKCLGILERALIRYFLSEGHDLVNKQGTRLRRHEIASVGSKRNVPTLMFVDRGRGE